MDDSDVERTLWREVSEKEAHPIESFKDQASVLFFLLLLLLSSVVMYFK